MRGHRLAELSSGAFFVMLKDMCDLNLATLLLEFPPGIDRSQKGALIQDYERARGSLLFALTLKQSCFCEPPLLLFGISSFDRATSVMAAENCFTATCSHPNVQRLQAEPLRSQVQAYIAGEELEALDSLLDFTAALRFGFSSERLVEGGHSQIHLRGASARRRTEAFDSLSLRLSEIRRALLRTDFMSALLECLEASRNPARLIVALGMTDHPSARLAKISGTRSTER